MRFLPWGDPVLTAVAFFLCLPLCVCVCVCVCMCVCGGGGGTLLYTHVL